MKNIKELPISMQSFSQIITENCVYVDKTEYVYHLAKSRRLYFLSRPRRFGKSLLVSTFECLFAAKEELFKGLWIHDKNRWQWKPYPIILLDFSSIPHRSTEELNTVLNFELEEQAAHNEIELKAPVPGIKLKELILKLKEKTGQDVVILINEYDKPIIDFLGKGEQALEVARKNSEFMKGFYGILKGAKVAESLRFVFITGVSKFTKVSIFSELNNLDDLTMQDKYAALLGYTHEELLHFFDHHIHTLADQLNIGYEETVERIRTWYYGFRFTDKKELVYNPASILNVFNMSSFYNCWFENGLPEFLVSLLKEKNYFLPQLEYAEVTGETFSTYDIQNLNIESFLFQRGYLTIKDVKEIPGPYTSENLYILSYPNEEIRVSFARNLFFQWLKVENGKSGELIQLVKYLDNSQYDNFIDTIKSLYASIPYTLLAKRDEDHFHSIFYLMMRGSGINAVSKVLSSKGRIDLLIETMNKVFIIEFKCEQSARQSIKEIKNKGYAEIYKGKIFKIVLMGIHFSIEERNIKEWIVKEIVGEV